MDPQAYLDAAHEVLKFLTTPQHTRAGPESTCVPGKSHPPSTWRTGQRKYWLFAAAGEGCKRCVAHYLEVEGVSPMSRSANMRYTVLDWALWARRQGKPGAADLIAYLKTEWAMVTATSLPETRRGKKRRAERLARTEGFGTPLTDGPSDALAAASGLSAPLSLFPAVPKDDVATCVASGMLPRQQSPHWVPRGSGGRVGAGLHDVFHPRQ